MKHITLFEKFALNEAAGVSESLAHWLIKKMNLNAEQLVLLGEGDNGIAFRLGDKTIKVTKDIYEVEFASAIKGKKLEHVSNVYEIHEYDSGSGEDNKEYYDNGYNCRYTWVIVKEFIPNKFRANRHYIDALRFFDDYQEDNKNFDYTPDSFTEMKNKFEVDMVENNDDDAEYCFEDDYEAQELMEYFNLFEVLHQELLPEVVSVSDMKIANMGFREDGTVVYLELHIYKEGQLPPHDFTKIHN